MKQHNNRIEKIVRGMRPKDMTEGEKRVMWSKIDHVIDQKQSSVIFDRLPIFTRRFAFASFSLLFIAGTAITIAAADNARPGDILFPVDVAAEKIQLVLSSRDKKDALRLKFAKERLDEVKVVLSLSGSHNFAGKFAFTESQNTTSTGFQEDQGGQGVGVGKAETAFITAIDHLEVIRSKFEGRDNQAASSVDKIIAELTNLAENQVSEFDKIKVKIKERGNSNIKIDIDAYTEKLKIKFKFKQNEFRGKEKIVICHIPLGNTANAHTLKISEAAADAHLTHGDTLGECDDDGGGNATSTPDVTPPLISDISSVPSTSSAEITWDTDEASDSRVWYSTTTPLIMASSTLVTSGDLVTAHSLILEGLNSSTTYYFTVGSEDSEGNLATFSGSSFVTLELADTIAPVISNINSTSSTSTATITWDTDEASGSKVWYSTTTPLVIASTTDSVTSGSLVVSHSIFLENLNATSTYYFIVNSEDVEGNLATSTEDSFVTLDN